MWDSTIDVGLTGFLGFEGVEDAVGGVADLERVPGDRALLGDGQRPAGLEECSQVVAFTGFGFEQGEDPKLYGHVWAFLGGGWSAAELVDGVEDLLGFGAGAVVGVDIDPSQHARRRGSPRSASATWWWRPR